jgi:hypothetical protein
MFQPSAGARPLFSRPAASAAAHSRLGHHTAVLNGTDAGHPVREGWDGGCGVRSRRPVQIRCQTRGVDIADYLDMIRIYHSRSASTAEPRPQPSNGRIGWGQITITTDRCASWRSSVLRITGSVQAMARTERNRLIDGGDVLGQVSIANHRVHQVQKLLARHCTTYVLDDLSQCCCRIGRA